MSSSTKSTSVAHEAVLPGAKPEQLRELREILERNSALLERLDRQETRIRALRERLQASQDATFGPHASPEFIEHVTGLQKAWQKDGKAGLRRFSAQRRAAS